MVACIVPTGPHSAGVYISIFSVECFPQSYEGEDGLHPLIMDGWMGLFVNLSMIGISVDSAST